MVQVRFSHIFAAVIVQRQLRRCKPNLSACERLICSMNHRNSLGVMIESLAYWPGQVIYCCMMIQSFAWLGPPVQPCEVHLAGDAEGLLIRSYRYMFVYLYITES